jgi:hypothetical protein
MSGILKDVAHNVTVTAIINAAAKNATTTSSAVDLTTAEAEATAVLLVVGAWTDGTHTPKIQDSDDNVTYADYTPVVGSFTAISGSGQQNATQLVNYNGGKRYIKVVVTVSGATTGAIYGAYLVQANPRTLATF